MGVILIYFIGKWHSTLAFDYHRKRWVFALLGILTYYAGTVIFQVAYILMEGETEGSSNLLLGLMSIPFGLIATGSQYYLLKKYWTKNPKAVEGELLDEIYVKNKESEF